MGREIISKHLNYENGVPSEFLINFAKLILTASVCAGVFGEAHVDPELLVFLHSSLLPIKKNEP